MASRRRNQQQAAAQNPNGAAGTSTRAIAEQYQGAGKSFKVKYLASKGINDYRSSSEAKDAIREIRKKGGSKSKMTITLHMKGMAVKDEKAKSMLIKVPMERVKFVCHDQKDVTVFAAIVQVEPSSAESSMAYRLYCFQADQNVAVSFVRSTNELFQILFKIMKARRKMREEEQRAREAAERAEAMPDDTPVTLGFGIPAPPPSYKTATSRQNSDTFVTPSNTQPVVLPTLNPPPVPKPRTKLPKSQPNQKDSPATPKARARPTVQELPSYEAVLDGGREGEMTQSSSTKPSVAPSGAVALGVGAVASQTVEEPKEPEHIYDVPVSPPVEANADRRQAVWEEWKTLDSELKNLAKELGMDDTTSASANVVGGASASISEQQQTPFETSFPSDDPFADDFFQESFGSPSNFTAQQSANASMNQSFDSFSAFNDSSFDATWGAPSTSSQKTTTPTSAEASLTKDPFSTSTTQTKPPKLAKTQSSDPLSSQAGPQQRTPTLPKPPATADPFSSTVSPQQTAPPPSSSETQMVDPFSSQAGTQQTEAPASSQAQASDPFSGFASPQQQSVPPTSPQIETGDLFSSLTSAPETPSPSVSPMGTNDPFASITSTTESAGPPSLPKDQINDPFLSMSNAHQQTTSVASPKVATNDPFSTMASEPQSTGPLTNTTGPVSSTQSPSSKEKPSNDDPFSHFAQTESPSGQSEAPTQVNSPQTSTTDAFANFESQTTSTTPKPAPTAAAVVLPKPTQQTRAEVVTTGISRARPKTQQRKASNSNVVSISSDLFTAPAKISTPKQQSAVSANNEPLSVQPEKQATASNPVASSEGANFFDSGNTNAPPTNNSFFDLDDSTSQPQQKQQKQPIASTSSADSFFSIDQPLSPPTTTSNNADPFSSTPTKPAAATTVSMNDPFSSGGQQQANTQPVTNFSLSNMQQSSQQNLKPQQPKKSSITSTEPLFSINEAPPPAANNDPFGSSATVLSPTSTKPQSVSQSLLDQNTQEEKPTTDWTNALREAATEGADTGWSTNLQEPSSTTHSQTTSDEPAASATGWSSSLQKMAPRTGLEAISNSPATSRLRPHGTVPPQRDFSDSGLVQLAAPPSQNFNPTVNPQAQQTFQNSSSQFATNFGQGNPGPQTVQPLNPQGFPPQSPQAMGSFATGWQQPNQAPGVAPTYTQANIPPQMMSGPRGPVPQSQMIPNQFAQGNQQMMAGPQSQMMPTQYQQMMQTQPPGVPPPAQQQILPGQQYPAQMQTQQPRGPIQQAFSPGQQMFVSPGGAGMPNAQMMGQPQQGYFPPGSNITSPPGMQGTSNLSSGGFTSPPYAVDFSTPQSSGGTPAGPPGAGNFASPVRPSFGTPGTMLTNENTGADPFGKLLTLALSPSKEKSQSSSKKEERKDDKSNAAASVKVSSLTGAEADNLLGSLDKPAPTKGQSSTQASSSSATAGFDDAFSPTGNGSSSSSKKPDGPWIDF